MGGSSAVEQLLMLRYALQQGMRPHAVVFGFFDFQLTHPLEYATRDLIGNRAMLYYMEPEYARGFYHLSLHDRAEFEIMRHFELFADRGQVWERVELFRRALAQQGMPPEKSNSMGRAVDFAMLEYPSAPEFIAECGRASRNPLIPSVREIALQAAAAGSKVYFVEMPMPPDHVQMFYDQPEWAAGYRAHLQQMLGDLGATYIDASHWMPDENVVRRSAALDLRRCAGIQRPSRRPTCANSNRERRRTNRRVLRKEERAPKQPPVRGYCARKMLRPSTEARAGKIEARREAVQLVRLLHQAPYRIRT